MFLCLYNRFVQYAEKNILIDALFVVSMVGIVRVICIVRLFSGKRGGGFFMATLRAAFVATEQIELSVCGF